ncbi:hypothetical protein IT418_00380 [bacterium]|nr:hypothetical protein [bacterium]
MPSVKRLFTKRIEGNISLTTVILVGALLIVSGMAVLSNAMDISLSTKSYLNRSMTDLRALTCIDEGMYRLAQNVTYTGNFTVTFPDGSCQVTVATVNATTKSITTTATYGQFSVTRVKQVNIAVTPMLLSN